MLHNLPGGGRPYPVNQPAAQVTLNAQQAGGLMDLAGGHPELRAILGMLRPFSGKGDPFPTGEHGQGAHGGEGTAVALH